MHNCNVQYISIFSRILSFCINLFTISNSICIPVSCSIDHIITMNNFQLITKTGLEFNFFLLKNNISLAFHHRCLHQILNLCPIGFWIIIPILHNAVQLPTHISIPPVSWGQARLLYSVIRTVIGVWDTVSNRPASPFVFGWSKYRLGLPLLQCIVGSHDQWEFPLFFRGCWESPCTALTAGTAIRAVQEDCERVMGQADFIQPSLYSTFKWAHNLHIFDEADNSSGIMRPIVCTITHIVL